MTQIETKPQPATARQVRQYYKDQGFEVHISKSGYVGFRVPFADAIWRDGRYVDEYRVIDGQVVPT